MDKLKSKFANELHVFSVTIGLTTPDSLDRRDINYAMKGPMNADGDLTFNFTESNLNKKQFQIKHLY